MARSSLGGVRLGRVRARCQFFPWIRFNIDRPSIALIVAEWIVRSRCRLATTTSQFDPRHWELRGQRICEHRCDIRWSDCALPRHGRGTKVRPAIERRIGAIGLWTDPVHIVTVRSPRKPFLHLASFPWRSSRTIRNSEFGPNACTPRRLRHTISSRQPISSRRDHTHYGTNSQHPGTFR